MIQAAIAQTADSVPSTSRPDVFTIVNSRQIDITGERARVLLLTACRVVAEEFHQNAEDVDLKVTLLVGESNERVAIDDMGRMTLYLERWDETKFVDGVITGAIQKLTPFQRQKNVDGDSSPHREDCADFGRSITDVPPEYSHAASKPFIKLH